MAKVGILMGSDSDMGVMAKAADFLTEMGIEFNINIISAHRDPQKLFTYFENSKTNGTKVIIAGAGMSAHLPGVSAALSSMPVIGIPMSNSLGGTDALHSIVQMPPGIPVATVAINGGLNAAILAAQILAVADEELFAKLVAYKNNMRDAVAQKDDRLNEVGYKNY
ncbi:MAG: 5-(carboxyamino)imidazole ribonucleotide mutase [Lachnospiraceae bacterium]|nr:5-(carboxyamino)imidazole ribonucleotide mutase [Lachnospiraceae bacterium]